MLDERGTVGEFFRASTLTSVAAGVGPWQQVNLTETRRGGVRGMHAEQMNKLVGVVVGSAFGAYVDLRPNSPTRGEVVTLELTPGRQVLVPRGVANGFQATGPDRTIYLYCFDAEWAPAMPGAACTPLDPALGFRWPLPVDPEDRRQISAKDRDAPRLHEVLAAAT